MNHTQPEAIENVWPVTVSVKERDGSTRATARLTFGDKEAVGVGLSRLGPDERGVAGIGRELAIARALSDLARRLLTASAHDIEAVIAAR